MKSLLLTTALVLPTIAWGSDAPDVTVETFIRAESDHMFRTNMANLGVEIGELGHVREPTTTDNQPIIRMNQDTLYSLVVLDLSEPAEITIPDMDGRYISMHVISQDHFMYAESTPGTYRLTQDDVGTRFAYIIFRTFADVTDPADIAAAHATQDAIGVSGGGSGPFEAPDWDTEALDSARQALNQVAVLGFNARYAFGREEDTRPIDHLVGSAAGWGGLPAVSASYVLDSVAANDGETPHAVTVRDVPVDAFWSVTVYNAEGFLEANPLGINSYNNYTAEAGEDGAITLHFGGCEDGRVNCIPITPGWNYAIRLYEPQAPVLDGSWTFPRFEPVP
ncbi:MAG: DUF1254 domain-containing protein [Pseudomonadota bacterium]